MKYNNYILTALGFALLTFNANAKSLTTMDEDFDISKVIFIEEDQDWELGFDTAKYLPENFDPYSGNFSVKAINFVDECDEIELGFETAGYLPEDFDAYTK